MSVSARSTSPSCSIDPLAWKRMPAAVAGGPSNSMRHGLAGDLQRTGCGNDRLLAAHSDDDPCRPGQHRPAIGVDLDRQARARRAHTAAACRKQSLAMPRSIATLSASKGRSTFSVSPTRLFHHFANSLGSSFFSKPCRCGKPTSCPRHPGVAISPGTCPVGGSATRSAPNTWLREMGQATVADQRTHHAPPWWFFTTAERGEYLGDQHIRPWRAACRAGSGRPSCRH